MHKSSEEHIREALEMLPDLQKQIFCLSCCQRLLTPFNVVNPDSQKSSDQIVCFIWGLVGNTTISKSELKFIEHDLDISIKWTEALIFALEDAENGEWNIEQFQDYCFSILEWGLMDLGWNPEFQWNTPNHLSWTGNDHFATEVKTQSFLLEVLQKGGDLDAMVSEIRTISNQRPVLGSLESKLIYFYHLEAPKISEFVKSFSQMEKGMDIPTLYKKIKNFGLLDLPIAGISVFWDISTSKVRNELMDVFLKYKPYDTLSFLCRRIIGERSDATDALAYLKSRCPKEVTITNPKISAIKLVSFYSTERSKEIIQRYTYFPDKEISSEAKKLLKC